MKSKKGDHIYRNEYYNYYSDNNDYPDHISIKKAIIILVIFVIVISLIVGIELLIK